ncbi:MAG TPA: TIGR03086 family metal-binding protein [Pseudonocardiaceae bacterium]
MTQHDGDMTLSRYATALAEFGHRVQAVRPGQWYDPTPCTEWDVRALVNHLVTEQLWAPLLLDGATLGDVGDRFDGDQLGDDPVATWRTAAAAARDAFSAPGALRRHVELSYGRRPADGYCREMTLDLTVHAWDLARAIGAEEHLDQGLVRDVLAFVTPQAGQLAGTGLFAAPIEVSDDADIQTRLLALLGRRA